MAKIRKDLEGVAMAVSAVGEPIILRAGDKVPDGVEVGDHLLEKKSSTSAAGEGSQSVPAKPEGVDGASGAADPAGSSTGSEDDDPLTPPPLVGAGSSTDAWRDYASKAVKKAGLELQVAPDAKRGDIVEALKGAGIATE